MPNEDPRQTANRFRELSDRAHTRQMPVYSEFLTVYAQEILCKTLAPTDFVLIGGYPDAERKIACFGAEAASCAPIDLVKIAPTAPKFADTLTHRDFLGSILALGLRRETVGDIVLHQNCGYVFCLPTAARCICAQLERVRHTVVRVASIDALPADAVPVRTEETVVVSSERLDAVIAAVYRISRADAQQLIRSERVFLNSRLQTRPDIRIPETTMVSVRGYGRFQYGEMLRETKKGRLRIQIFR